MPLLILTQDVKMSQCKTTSLDSVSLVCKLILFIGLVSVSNLKLE